VVAFERRIFSATDCILAVQGHARSLILPFLRYGELLAENCEFFLPHSHLKPSLQVNPFEFWMKFFVLGYSLVKIS